MKEKAPHSASMNLPIWKKILFSLSVLFFIFLFLEVGSRLLPKPAGIHADPFVSFSGNAPLFIEAEAPSDGSAIMKTAPYKLIHFQDQQFSKEKATGVYRIFCLGGSTTYGRPYNDQTSFSGWLRETLPVADPSKIWEVINAGGVSYASYRVASLMEELVEYEPDLFIIYTGQNEFLEERRYADSNIPKQTVLKANELLSHSSLYRLMKKSIDRATGRAATRSRNETLLPEEVETILGSSTGPSSYERDDFHQRKAVEHFRSNLDRMIAIAKSAEAQIAFVKPASNLKNCTPFKSQAREGLDIQQTRHWEALIDQAQVQASAAEWDSALATLNAASQIDDRQATLHYLKGTILYQSSQYEEAKASFRRALEEDVCPLRAIQSIASAVDAATAVPEVMLVDFENLVSTESPHHIAGEELFIDHVHPTIEGNRLLSIQILDALSENKILSFTDNWKGDASLAEIKWKVESGLDPLFHGRALRNLARIYRWAGKSDEGYRLAKQALQRLPEDPETLYLMGANALDIGRFEEAIQNLEASKGDRAHYHVEFALAEAFMGIGDLEQAISHYQAALQIEPSKPVCINNLGNAFLASSQWDEAIAAYERVIHLDTDYTAGLSNLALALHRKGETDAAITQYLKAIKERPNDADTMSNLGSLYIESEQLAEAQAILKEALRHDPYLFEVVFNLALLAIQQERSDDAMKHLQEAIAIRPEAYEAHMELGELLMDSGRTKEAAQAFGRATQVDPNAAEAYFLAALALTQEGRLSEARYLSQQAIERQPTWTKAVGLAAELALARPSFSESAKDEALSLAQEAARLSNQEDPKILVSLTRAYLINGQTAQAQTTARQAKENAERLGLSSLAERIATQFENLLEEEAQDLPSPVP